MEIWPAIDLRGGRCVRLQQGDYGRETVFGEDPAAQARLFVAQGAQYLHLVDLDGARDGQLVNLDAIRAIVSAVSIPCELGGGVRDEAAIRRLLDLGLSRVVIGTLALREPEWFRSMCRLFPQQLALGVDARDGLVATHGWLETSSTRAIDLARQFEQEPVAAVIMTDIATDGMLQGPNVAALDEFRRSVNLPLIASGGVTTADDVRNLHKINVAGCIIGRALYEGALTLAEALSASKGAA